MKELLIIFFQLIELLYVVATKQLIFYATFISHQ